MNRAAAVLVLGLAVGVAGTPARADSNPTGTWIMDNGKVTIRVSECGGSLCATIIGLKKPRDKYGNIKLDKENPNPALRGRPVVGLTIISNARPDGGGRWKGKIYNPDDGNFYSSRVRLVGDDVMKVQGCVAGVLCKGMKFMRIK